MQPQNLCHDNSSFTATCHLCMQAEVRALTGQLESVKQELATEKQKCRLLEQTSASATADGMQISESPKQELISECILYDPILSVHVSLSLRRSQPLNNLSFSFNSLHVYTSNTHELPNSLCCMCYYGLAKERCSLTLKYFDVIERSQLCFDL